jgi:hypothetical protein
MMERNAWDYPLSDLQNLRVYLKKWCNVYPVHIRLTSLDPDTHQPSREESPPGQTAPLKCEDEPYSKEE